MPTGFRYDINALRAIAVLGVVIFHYAPSFCPGGFAGVDVFFVISGYLMSRIIIGALSAGNFSVWDFYQRRIKRIIPALLFLVLIATMVCFFICLPNDYRLTEKNATASLLFISNIIYQHRLNYFDPASNRNMFLHTWSLSVEWQFYLIYPLILLLIIKFIKAQTVFLVTFIGITILFFAASIFYTDYNTSVSFYFLHSRCWELLLGGIAYLLEGKLKSGRFPAWPAFIGYALIALSFGIFRNDTPWPGFATLLPVLATFLVIIANHNRGGIIGHKVIQFFGSISYSLYLWHWPVLVIAEYLGMPLRLLSAGGLFIISTILAYLSFTYVERPGFNYKKVMVATALFLGLTVTLSYTTVNGFIFKPKTLKIANYAAEHKQEIKQQFGENGCFVDTEDSTLVTFNREYCLNIEKSKQNILLIGDSHAAGLSQPLIKTLNQHSIHLIQTTAVGCLPVLQSTGNSGCTNLINYIYRDFIEKNADKLNGVILSANWINAGVRNQAVLLERLKETISFLNKHGLKVLLIGQSEVYHIPYSTVAAREYEYGINVRQYAVNQNAYNLNAFLIAQLKPWYVDIYNMDNAPAISAKDIPYMFDENHYTVYGAEIAAKRIMENKLTRAFLGIRGQGYR